MSWRNQMAKLVGGRKVLLFLGCLVSFLAAAFGYFATSEFVQPLLASLPGDDAIIARLAGLLFSNIAVVASSLLGIFLLLSPSRTALDNLLAAKPVTRDERTIGYLLPLIAVTLVMVAVCFSPIFGPLLYGGSFPILGALWFLFVTVSHALYVTLASLVLHLLVLGVLLRAFAAGYALSQVIAASVVILVAFSNFVLNLRTLAGSPANDAPLVHPFDLHAFLFRVSLSGEGGAQLVRGLLVMVVIITGHLLLWFALVRVSQLVAPACRPPRLAWLKALPTGRRGFSLFLLQELKQAGRHPENLVFAELFVFLSALLVAFSWMGGVDLDNYALQLPLLIWLLCSLFSHNSYGRTMPSHWLVRVVPHHRYVWLSAKIAANCLLSGALAAVLFLVYAPISDQVTVFAYVQTAMFGALFTVAVTLAGTILPYSEEYPFSAAASALLVTVAGVPLGYVFQRFVQVVPENSVAAFSLGFTLLLAALIYLVDVWRYGSDVDAV